MINKEELKGQLKIVVDALDAKKGEDIAVLDLIDLKTIADYFVVCTGNSAPQVKALAENVELKLKETLGLMPHHTEGYQTGSWILLDYGCVVVHVFHKEAREFYGLEKLWVDGKKISIDDIQK